jgi:hypothetical protein
MQQHHRAEVGQDLIEAERGYGVEGRDDTKGGDYLEAIVVLVDKGKLLALRADTQVVEDDVLFGVYEFGAGAFCSLCFFDGGEDGGAVC